MSQLPKVGDKWACLEVIGRDKIENEENELGYGRFIACVELQCECGKVFRVPGFGWKGKNIMRDCGCGTYINTARTVVFSVNIRQDYREAIARMATDNQIKESEAMRIIIEAGLGTLGYRKERV
jgi:hypothetical protein